MGAKTSSEMLKARQMIIASKGKASPASVAAACNLTTGAITRSKWYQDFMKNDADETLEDQAKRLITKEGKTAYYAAKVTGLSQSTISRKQWYRDHIERETQHA